MLKNVYVFCLPLIFAFSIFVINNFCCALPVIKQKHWLLYRSKCRTPRVGGVEACPKLKERGSTQYLTHIDLLLPSLLGKWIPWECLRRGMSESDSECGRVGVFQWGQWPLSLSLSLSLSMFSGVALECIIRRICDRDGWVRFIWMVETLGVNSLFLSLSLILPIPSDSVFTPMTPLKIPSWATSPTIV